MEGKPRARLFVVSGPSGAGKGTVLSKVRELRPDLGLTVSATTREPRAGEVDGVSYHFLSEAEFRQRIAQGEFLEWADVHGHLYGTLRKDVDTLLAAGSSLVLEIDVQGALNVRESYPEAVLVLSHRLRWKNLKGVCGCGVVRRKSRWLYVSLMLLMNLSSLRITMLLLPTTILIVQLVSLLRPLDCLK